MKLTKVGVRKNPSDGEVGLSRREVEMTFECYEIVLY
jgi:hypothetical protein